MQMMKYIAFPCFYIYIYCGVSLQSRRTGKFSFRESQWEETRVQHLKQPRCLGQLVEGRYVPRCITTQPELTTPGWGAIRRQLGWSYIRCSLWHTLSWLSLGKHHPAVSDTLHISHYYLGFAISALVLMLFFFYFIGNVPSVTEAYSLLEGEMMNNPWLGKHLSLNFELCMLCRQPPFPRTLLIFPK